MIDTKKIMEILNNIGAPKANLGYKYLTDIVSGIDSGNFNMMAEYERVAGINNTTPSRVERAIRHEIELIFDRNVNSELLSSICPYINPRGSVSNKEFIANVFYYVNYNN